MGILVLMIILIGCLFLATKLVNYLYDKALGGEPLDVPTARRVPYKIEPPQLESKPEPAPTASDKATHSTDSPEPQAEVAFSESPKPKKARSRSKK